jgi:hypothetical protein
MSVECGEWSVESGVWSYHVAAATQFKGSLVQRELSAQPTEGLSRHPRIAEGDSACAPM